MTQLIIALDYSNQTEALKLVSVLDPGTCALKVGSEMFTLFGTSFVSELIHKGFKIFLDLKFHDIPNTVAHACRAAAELGVWMLNVHAIGGMDMLKAARDAVNNAQGPQPLLIAVTVLTSMTNDSLPALGISESVETQVARLANLAYQAGMDGVVCSAFESTELKNLYGQSFLTVTPGIRLPADDTHDQSRIATPKLAKDLGSDFIVVGRSITRAADPAKVVNLILATLSAE